jgi:hypothetical protein
MAIRDDLAGKRGVCRCGAVLEIPLAMPLMRLNEPIAKPSSSTKSIWESIRPWQWVVGGTVLIAIILLAATALIVMRDSGHDQATQPVAVVESTTGQPNNGHIDNAPERAAVSDPAAPAITKSPTATPPIPAPADNSAPQASQWTEEQLRADIMNKLAADPDFQDWQAISSLKFVEDPDQLIGMNSILTAYVEKYHPNGNGWTFWQSDTKKLLHINQSYYRGEVPWGNIRSTFDEMKQDFWKTIASTILTKSAHRLPVNLDAIRKVGTENGMPAILLEDGLGDVFPINANWTHADICMRVTRKESSVPGGHPNFSFDFPSIEVISDKGGNLFEKIGLSMDADGYQGGQFLGLPQDKWKDYQDYEIDYLKERLASMPNYWETVIRMFTQDDAATILASIHALSIKSRNDLIKINEFPYEMRSDGMMSVFSWLYRGETKNWKFSVVSGAGAGLIFLNLSDKNWVDEQTANELQLIDKGPW